MALLHNALIRGFNSIYLQAEHIPRGQVDEFIGYALTWHKFIVSHHDDEEDKLFPDVVAILRDESVWGDMHSEHGTFFSVLCGTPLHSLLSTIRPYVRPHIRVYPRACAYVGVKRM